MKLNFNAFPFFTVRVASIQSTGINSHLNEFAHRLLCQKTRILTQQLKVLIINQSRDSEGHGDNILAMFRFSVLQTTILNIGKLKLGCLATSNYLKAWHVAQPPLS
mmetsp:Transcript_21296/g.39177  ORF Transcript_21296/g.39177 Transcript_21296/m.39177 type:complete len:106 (+) Transcript_21296:182-499(+)